MHATCAKALFERSTECPLRVIFVRSRRCRPLRHVCFAPKSDIQRASNYALTDDADHAAAGHPGGALSRQLW